MEADKKTKRRDKREGKDTVKPKAKGKPKAKAAVKKDILKPKAKAKGKAKASPPKPTPPKDVAAASGGSCQQKKDRRGVAATDALKELHEIGCVGFELPSMESFTNKCLSELYSLILLVKTTCL